MAYQENVARWQGSDLQIGFSYTGIHPDPGLP